MPSSGPVLLVANHPNSLFDPALVAAAAQRPVRFLAKAPLFSDPAVGWLVRAAGAIPVYRVQDDPASMGRNEEAFRAAHAALAEGSAIGIFPEGISHDLPALQPLKTGAARLALGAAAQRGAAFPIIPIGLTFRGKERFRSEALVTVGEPIEWADLADDGHAPDAVRELTLRIAAALEAQTLNLAGWEDAPLIEWAAAIYATEFGSPADALGRALYERRANAVLSRLRQEGSGEWQELARTVREHAKLMQSFGLEARDARDLPPAAVAARWTARNAAYLLLTGALGALGSVLFYPPYKLTGVIVDRLRVTTDTQATYRALGGGLFFAIWIAMLALAATVAWGYAAGIAIGLVLPPLALFTLAFRDRLFSTFSVARRFLLLRTRNELRQELADRQRRIAHALHEVWLRASPREPLPS